MATLYMLVGLPGAGKTEYAKKIDAYLVSSDEIREKLFGDKDKVDNKKVFNEIEKIVKTRLKAGSNVIYDATNINSNRRRMFLKSLSEIECEKICLFFATDYDKCLENCHIDKDVDLKMLMQIDIPAFREGWDSIQIIVDRVENKDYDIYKYIDNLPHIDSPNGNGEYLTEYIQKRLSKIMDKYKLSFAGDEKRLDRLTRAALYCNVGESVGEKFKNMEAITKVSAYMYLVYNNELKSVYEILDTADLIVGYGELMDSTEKTDEKIRKKLLKRLGQEKFEDVCILKENS